MSSRRMRLQYFCGPPSAVIANSLFITGCWKTTWAWTKETGRKPNGREEKRTVLSVVLDQGRQKRLRKLRALLCKPSCDVDSHKPNLSVMLDQGRQKRLREQRALLCKPKSWSGFTQTNSVIHARSRSAKKAQKQRALYENQTDIYGNRIPSLEGIAKETEGKGKSQENGSRDTTRIQTEQQQGGLSSRTRLCTSHPATPSPPP
jgi:hypothetical protein